MISKSRRSFIRLAAGTVGATVATSMLPSSIQAALAIPAHRRHGNLKDVEHVVILMQENRSFDHYFGTLKGVRGFGDRMAIPLPDGQRVWHQKGSKGEILPYHFDTSTTSAQRVDGTPHTWPDAQQAWNEGRMDKWLPAKTERSLGYYKEQDIAFQFAMANAFTICDAYHCSFQGGTNPNRLFLWTGTNDPLGQHGGPVTTNDHDSNGPVEQGYTWTTYPERLQAAGITWRVYQDMADNFSDNPLIGFRQYRAAAPDSPLIVNGLSTWKLDALKREFPELPDTSQADAIVASQIKLPKPKPPAVAAMPKQEMGIRPARALPYELGVHARYRSGGDALSLTFANTGKAGAVFQVFDLLDSENPPKRYTVGARKRLHDSFQGDASGDYHLEVHGPNGFLRVFRGNLRRDLAERKAPLPEVRIDYEPLFGNLRVQLINRGRHPVKLTVKDNVYRQGERRTVNVPPGQRREVRYSLRSSGNWYDFSVSAQGADSFLRRFSGRMEDGRSGFSDPGMGLGTLTF